MTNHKAIQNPENFSEKDYQKWEYLLFDEETSQDELEDIVMILAHLPSEKARNLLKRFKMSNRAHEVQALEPAMEENEMWMTSPDTPEKERDMKAMKLVARKVKAIIELEIDRDTYQYRIDLLEIELDALNNLLDSETDEEQKKDIEVRVIVMHDLINLEQKHISKAKYNIQIEEKIIAKIKENVKTEAYKTMDFSGINGWHFDGEE